ncbi:hypothetical protein MPLB_1760084 [Mesorhizobium sp. ORS 3324]|nr:hypothetical protein MPLB_1760084 [Mesorhizobium sp. ORS 3324]
MAGWIAGAGDWPRHLSRAQVSANLQRAPVDPDLDTRIAIFTWPIESRLLTPHIGF